jgi:hypothetical protein
VSEDRQCSASSLVIARRPPGTRRVTSSWRQSTPSWPPRALRPGMVANHAIRAAGQAGPPSAVSPADTAQPGRRNAHHGRRLPGPAGDRQLRRLAAPAGLPLVLRLAQTPTAAVPVRAAGDRRGPLDLSRCVSSQSRRRRGLGGGSPRHCRPRRWKWGWRTGCIVGRSAASPTRAGPIRPQQGPVVHIHLGVDATRATATDGCRPTLSPRCGRGVPLRGGEP